MIGSVVVLRVEFALEFCQFELILLDLLELGLEVSEFLLLLVHLLLPLLQFLLLGAQLGPLLPDLHLELPLLLGDLALPSCDLLPLLLLLLLQAALPLLAYPLLLLLQLLQLLSQRLNVVPFQLYLAL